MKEGFRDHFKNHRITNCLRIQESMDIQKEIDKNIERCGDATINIKSKGPLLKYIPLSTVDNWKSFFLDIWGSEFGFYIEEDFHPGRPKPAGCTFTMLGIESTSFLLTILAALESQVPDLAERTTLSIHVVGANTSEWSHRYYEEILHFLPKLKELVFGYVGPEASPDDWTQPNGVVPINCCSVCKQQLGRSSWYVFHWSGFYHDFVETPLFGNYPPDLIVAFHSLHQQVEARLWEPTLKSILKLDVPAVFTTLRLSEYDLEVKALEKMGAYFPSMGKADEDSAQEREMSNLKRTKINPWKGMIWYYDNWANDSNASFYTNNYWYIVKGRREEWLEQHWEEWNRRLEEDPDFKKGKEMVREVEKDLIAHGADFQAVVEHMELSGPDLEAVSGLKHLKSDLYNSRGIYGILTFMTVRLLLYSSSGWTPCYSDCGRWVWKG